MGFVIVYRLLTVMTFGIFSFDDHCSLLNRQANLDQGPVRLSLHRPSFVRPILMNVSSTGIAREKRRNAAQTTVTESALNLLWVQL